MGIREINHDTLANRRKRWIERSRVVSVPSNRCNAQRAGKRRFLSIPFGKSRVNHSVVLLVQAPFLPSLSLVLSYHAAVNKIW